MAKRYSRSVFSGKEVPFIGISEGHGKLFRGNSVEFSVNVRYKGSIELRDGAVYEQTLNGRIHIGHSGNMRAICSGSNIYIEE